MKTIIIGAGPAGLTLSMYLRKAGHEVLIIDKADSIGGCHRVNRVDGYFSEHGPRIYLDNYVNTISMLEDIGINFFDFYTPYNFNLSNIGGESLRSYSARELLQLSLAYIRGVDRYLTVSEFLDRNKFSEGAIDYTDRLCRLTDGAGIDRYTMYQFLQLINQNMLHIVYQPNIANDRGLFRTWRHQLEKMGVKFLMNAEVRKLIYNRTQTKIESIDIGNVIIPADLCIMAVPPHNIHNLLQLPVSLRNFAEKSGYMTYLSITFHWHKKIILPKIYGFPKTEWGVAFIVLSDYMDMINEKSKTLVSVALTYLDRLSTVIGKTANQSSRDEMIKETFRQLRISFPDLPYPDKVIISPETYRHPDGRWGTTTEAFMTTKHGYIPQTTHVQNLYNVGTHNGFSSYSFTSMESAVQNAMVLAERITSKKIKIKWFYTLNHLILIILLLIAVTTIIYYTMDWSKIMYSMKSLSKWLETRQPI